MSLNRRGLSLLEVVMVVALISVLMALSLPMMSNANARARAELCQQNLIDLGQCICCYAEEHGKLPTLAPIEQTQHDQSLPEFIETRLQTPGVLFCPSDETAKSQTLGTSYRWSTEFNGMRADQLPGLIGQTLLADREDYHACPSTPANELILVDTGLGLHMSLFGEQRGKNKSCPQGLKLVDPQK
ncbi:MAG: type II secretion system protein [Planctomycetota bacterium]